MLDFKNNTVKKTVAVGTFALLLLGFSFFSVNAMMQSAELENKKETGKSEAIEKGTKNSFKAFQESVDGMMKDRVLGDKDAPITIIAYSSFTCSHCADFHTKILPELKKELIDTGKVKFVFRDFPMEGKAAAASMLSRCAPQDAYYNVLDTFFSTQSEWVMFADTKEKLTGYVSLLGMSDEDTKACLKNESLLKALMAMRTDAVETYKINATPSFVIQKGIVQEKIVGAVSLSQFKDAIKKLNG